MGKVRCWRSEDGRKIKEEEEEVCIDKVKMEGRSKRMRRSLERSEDGRKIKEEAEAMKKKKRKRKEVGIIKKVETTTKKKKRKRKEVGIDKVVKQRNKVASINNKIKKREQVGIKETTPEDVKNGDKFNLSDLLFTKDRDFLIKYNDDQPVQISQLAGKKIIVLFDNDWLNYYPLDMKRLEEMYGQMKGTDDEFEVIQVFHSKRTTIADVPWLTHPCLKKDSDAKKVSCSVLPAGSGLLAFDHEGTVVRRATWPIFEEDTGFPFYNGDVKKEVLTDVRSGYTWDYYSDDDM